MAQVQILDEADCIAYSTNISENDMHPTILRTVRVGFFNLDMANGLGEGNLWIQTSCTSLKIDLVPAALGEGKLWITQSVKLHLKTDLVLHPAHVEMLENFDKLIHHFQPETKTLIRKLERILIKLYRQNVSLIFTQTCLNEILLLNHTHTCIYIYIYIYIIE